MFKHWSASLIGSLTWLRRWAAPSAVTLAMVSALLLPLNLLVTQRFHHDEALYATWALEIASGRNPWLAHVPIDKPPLFLYTVAASLWLLGSTETAARMPSLLATVVTVGLTFGLGRKLYNEAVGVLAAWLVALSPFTILFAPTAFTDPMLVTLVLAAGLAAVYARPGWAGFFLGLAIITKQQGVFFAPLVWLLGIKCQVSSSKVAGSKAIITSVRDNKSICHSEAVGRRIPRILVEKARFWGLFAALRVTCPRIHSYPELRLIRFMLYVLLTTLLILLPAFLWDYARDQSPGFWQMSLVNYGGLEASLVNFGERWGGFVELLKYGTASPLLNTIFVAGWPLLLIYGFWPRASANVPAAQTDRLLSLFALVFLLAHTWLSFQVWDRYLLGLIPLLALLLARILLLPWPILTYWQTRRPKWRPATKLIMVLALVFVLIVSLAGPVQDAANARYPLGSNSAALSGIEQITAYLRGHAGANTTLYHRWLGTHWRFYLWGYPYDLQYWPSPQDLAARAKTGDLIAFPSWHSDTEARLALAEAGLHLRELTRAYTPAGYPSIIVYRIEGNKE